MKAPTDKSYRFPAWVIFALLSLSVLGVWLTVKALMSRTKHSWPW